MATTVRVLHPPRGIRLADMLILIQGSVEVNECWVYVLSPE